MTTKELSNRIAEQTGMTKRMTDQLMAATIDSIVEALNQDQIVMLQNFGSLNPKDRPARRVRNPKTGEQQLSEAKRVVTFQVNPQLKQQIK